MLTEYNSAEQERFLVEGDSRSASVADCDEAADPNELFSFSPFHAGKAWIASIEKEASASDRIRCEIANRLSVDEPAHPQERELRALMTASLDGDGAAYHALLKRLTAHLRAYYRHRFARIGHGPTEAEDLLQEVLIAVHNHRHTYDRLQPFTPWIHAIARYKFLDYLRRTKSSFKDLPAASAERTYG